MQKNLFNIHARFLWEANIDAQFILNPYVMVAYYTCYLTKVNKSMTR